MTNTAKFNFFKKNISQRNVLNVGFNSGSEQRFINIFSTAEQWGPFGNTGQFFGTSTWMQSIGANGYPNVSAALGSGREFGGGVRFPNGRYYGGASTGKYWVLRWKGKGVIEFFSLATNVITHVAGMSSNVTFGNPGSGVRWTTIDGSKDSYAVFNYEGAAILFSLIVRATDPDSVGQFVNSIELYRLDDESDRNAGLIYRMPYKLAIKDLCPSALRFMDWVGGNDRRDVRAEYRTLPSAPTWTGRNWNAGGPYGRTTGQNQYTLAGHAGTPTGMLHGEVVNYQVASGAVRGGGFTVSAITTGPNGRVTTTAAHGYSNGDKVRLKIASLVKTGLATVGSDTITGLNNNTSLADGSEIFSPNFPVGTTVISSTSNTCKLSAVATSTSQSGSSHSFMCMSKIHWQIATVAVVDTLNFDTGINTSTYGNFAGTGSVEQFISLRVGSGGDRDFDYPIAYASMTNLAAGFGNSYFATNEYKTVVFDKTMSAMKDSSGNFVYGVWVGTNEQGNYAYSGGVPLEVCVALINEVNALGPAKPIHMWINHSMPGLTSNDPDYNVNSHLGIQTMNVLFNGANGYPGLLPHILVYLENSNETWNTANNAFSQSYYGQTKSWLRWPQTGFSDLSSWSTLKSSLVMDDILQAFPTFASRIKTVLAGQGSPGVGGNTINDIRIDGTSYYANDPLVTGNPRLNGKKPMQYPHDHYAFAGYMGSQASYKSGRLLTLAANWVAAVGNPTAQEAACADFVNDLANGTNGIGGETMFRYGLTLLPGFCAKLAPMRKTVIMYEGGWDDAVVMINSNASQYLRVGAFTSGSDTITGLSSTFVTAVAVGNWVRGYGIPTDARVLSKPTSTSLQLDKPVSITATYGEIAAFTDVNAYLYAVKRSQAWSNGLIQFFDYFKNTVNAGMPSDYVARDIRWGHISPESYGLSNTEFTDFDKVWFDEGARNRALPI